MFKLNYKNKRKMRERWNFSSIKAYASRYYYYLSKNRKLEEEIRQLKTDKYFLNKNITMLLEELENKK